jgi:hypothetical protein
MQRRRKGFGAHHSSKNRRYEGQTNSVQLLKGLSHEMDLPLITCMVSSKPK